MAESMSVPRPASLDAAKPPGRGLWANGGAPGGTDEAMRLRGVRGATTVSANTREAIVDAATELLSAIIEANDIQLDDVASVPSKPVAIDEVSPLTKPLGV